MNATNFGAALLRRGLLPALLLGAVAAGHAQDRVGIGTATPHASAILDVSSTTQGLLTPRLTLAQRTAIASPATGLLLYQTDGTAGFYFYDGAAWTALSGGTGSAGANGLNALVRTAPEAPGATCPTGGTRFDTGQDANGNGTLDAAEISGTRYVCNGATGATGPQGDAGDTGATGATGTTGPQGDAGLGVPAGGTAGQVLTKVDATDYNTAWRTASASGSNISTQLRANKVGGTGETLPVATSTTAPTIAFNNVLTTPTLGTWDGTTYTVGTGGAGLYLIQANVLTADAATPTQTPSANLVVEVNNAGYGSTAGSVYYGLWTSLNPSTPTGTKGRGELSRVVYLNAGDSFKIRGVSSTSSLATQPISTVAASYLAVLKLN
ncbi:hypothetical protein EJV47_01310 [Hymenobacter gummosus]|uniref:DUF7151 domain-containing protein n=1 Tax=Hymenobacter gummosus TaxID=1776032 RepID=A0A3S0JH74_9BACT|nr:hypothetical protein [Hymenobacter gummosus]RTQ53408.1 hypothetical protein EJV47_01310 [Hymenobacter gummosus]